MPVTLPATPTANLFDAATTSIREFREALPSALQGDFDKTLRDIAQLAEQGEASEVKTLAEGKLGGLLGGVVAKGVSHAIASVIDTEVKAVEQ